MSPTPTRAAEAVMNPGASKSMKSAFFKSSASEFTLKYKRSKLKKFQRLGKMEGESKMCKEKKRNQSRMASRCMKRSSGEVAVSNSRLLQQPERKKLTNREKPFNINLDTLPLVQKTISAIIPAIKEVLQSSGITSPRLSVEMSHQSLREESDGKVEDGASITQPVASTFQVGVVKKLKYEKLKLSLESPLPNEHQYVLDVLLLLSAVNNSNPEGLNVIETTPALLNILLAHVGFYSDCDLRLLMEQTYKEAYGHVGEEKECLNFTSFWERVYSTDDDDGITGEKSGTLKEQEYRKLLCECYSSKVSELSETEIGILLGIGSDSAEASAVTKCSKGCCAKLPFVEDEKQGDMIMIPLSFNQTSKAMKMVGDRIQLVCEVMRNFSFHRGNARVMANNSTMFRFLLVAMQAEYQSLAQIAFDIMSNISKYATGTGSSSSTTEETITLEQLKCMVADSAATTFISSNDRFRILRSLETMNGLLLSYGNREIRRIITLDHRRCFERLFQFLTLMNDAILVTTCLECVLAVTEIGEMTCEEIVRVRGSISVLIAYTSRAAGARRGGVINNSTSLTAMLVIRNLVKHSNSAKGLLKQYEPRFAEIAISEDDRSWIAAEILYYMTD